MFGPINDQVRDELNTVMASTPDDEPLAANLVPVAMNYAAGNDDLINMLAAHYVATVHVLATGHTEHDKKPVGLIVSEVEALVNEALSQSREKVTHTPEFYQMVRKSAAMQQKAANE